MKKKGSILGFSILTVAATSVTTGFGGWIIEGGQPRDYAKYDSGDKIVCTIGSTGYTNIGKAIEKSKSGDTIEVIPGNKDRNSKHYTITTKNASKILTIPQGVTLNIPYEAGVANKKIASGSTSVHAFGNRDTYCKSSVILGDGLTLINNGTIEIGGVIGAGSGGVPSGCTAGNYSEFILGKGSKLENHNKINLYGYLGEKNDGESDFVIKPNISGVRPSVFMPMYWYDFGGGSALKAIYDAIDTRYCMPIDDFYFENIGTKTRIYGGSDVTSWVNLYAASNNGEYDLKVIGSDASGIINLPNNSYLDCNYNETTLINDLNFYGPAFFNALTIDVEKAIKDTAGAVAWGIASVAGIPSKVTSASGYFPVSYHYNVSLNKKAGASEAVFDGASNRYKFLNGSTLKIGNGAKLSVKELAVYKGDDIYSGRGTHASSLRKSKTPLTPASMNIQGSLVGDILAGRFDATVAGGDITAKNGTALTMYEPKAGEGSNTNAKMLPAESGWFYIPLTLKLKKSNGLVEDGETGKYYCEGPECYWEKSKELTAVNIKETSNNYSSGRNQAATFNIVAEFNPSDYADKIVNFSWKQKRRNTSVSEDGTFENSTLSSTVFKTKKNKNLAHNNYIDVWLEITVEGKTEIIKSNVVTFNAKFYLG